MWVVFLDDTGECWTFDNSDIRADKNLTYGRDNPEKPPRKIDWKKGESQHSGQNQNASFDI